MSTIFRGISVTLIAAAAISMLGASAAQAEATKVKGNCDAHVCIAIDVSGATVNDATVSTMNGKPAKLHLFIGNKVDRWTDRDTHNKRWDVNRSFDRDTLACGEAWVGHHMLGRACVTVW